MASGVITNNDDSEMGRRATFGQITYSRRKRRFNLRGANFPVQTVRTHEAATRHMSLNPSERKESGACGGIRTPDRLITNQVPYHLATQA
tara:strand:- start:243 stop:512 length:270 start_codon:yes stop_codon:yes gene_type:complete